MAIKGMTDSLQGMFCCIGKLRKGGPSQNGQFGEDLDHFRFTSEKPEIVEAFCAVFGKQPRAMRVYLPYPTVDDNFSTWKEKWDAGGLHHRCDGETMVIWRGDDGKYHTNPRPCPYHNLEQTTKEKRENPPCREVGRLSVIIPELWIKGYIGYVTMETHGKNDTVNITRSLVEALRWQQLLGAQYGLQGVQFVLRRSYEMISTPRPGGKRVWQGKWLVRLDPAASWMQLQLEAAKARSLPSLAAPAGAATAKAPMEVPIDTTTGEVLEPPEGTGYEDAEWSPLPEEEEGAEKEKEQEQDKNTDDWKSDPTKREEILRLAKGLGMGKAELVEALGVQRYLDWPGTYEEMVDAVQTYGMKRKRATAQRVAPPEPSPGPVNPKEESA